MLENKKVFYAPKITATVNTNPEDFTDLPKIQATVKTDQAAPELPKISVQVKQKETIVGNIGTMIAGKGKDGKDGKDGQDGRDGIDGKTPEKNVDYFDGKDGYTPIKGVDYFDGADGKDGKDGYTPIKGVDYFDGKDGLDGKDGQNGYTPQKGIDYFDGKDGRDGKDGKNGRTPIKGIDYRDGKDGKDGKDGLNGLNGRNGFSPIISIEEIDGGHRVIITDKNGEKSFNVMDGIGGGGESGNDGFSPTITVEEIDGGHRLTITDANGTKTIDVLNGLNGKDGQQGKDGVDGRDGYTPQKNIDYFDGKDGSPGKDGKDGEPGKDGQDGYTPVKGVDYFDGEPGKDGAPGADGQPGKDGYSPVRGTDYWTTADIQGIINEAVNGVLAQKSTILETAYPVGAIYMSTVSTSPKTLFGFGTWEQIQDKFLLASGSSYAAGSVGGSATHSHKYKTGARIYYGMVAGADADAHMAYDYVQGKWIPAVKDDGQSSLPVKANAAAQASTKEVSPYFMASEAQTETKNNMPPYLAVYVWKRTA